MKKVRISLARGSKERKILVFNNPESIYVWSNDPDLQSENKLDPSLGIAVSLRRGEIMEIEWRGCEFINDGSFKIRADYIRIGKVIKTKSLMAKNLIGIHSGWIKGDSIPFKNSLDEEIKSVLLTEKSKHKFDLDELFDVYGKQDLEEPEIDLNNLN